MEAVSGKAAEPFIVGNTEGGLHIVENPAGHMTLKWLIQNDKQRIKAEQKGIQLTFSIIPGTITNTQKTS
jgi:pumilio family protein 6